jgi:hypothetical protein
MSAENKETAALSEADRLLYVEVLKQQRLRGEVAKQFLAAATYPNVESAALQLRFILELIPLAALIANREWVEPVAAAFDRKDPMEARKLVKRANPEYWPVPGERTSYVRDGPDQRGRHEFVGIRDGFLTESEWASEWGYVSRWLHARNPYRAAHDLDDERIRLTDLLARIRRLLACHLLLLPAHNVALIGLLETAEGESAVLLLGRPAADERAS